MCKAPPFFPSQKDTILSSILSALVSKVALTVGGEHDHQPLKHRDEHATGKNDDVVVIVCAPTRDAEAEAAVDLLSKADEDPSTSRRADEDASDATRCETTGKSATKRREGNPSSSSRNPRSQSKTHSEEHDYSNQYSRP